MKEKPVADITPSVYGFFLFRRRMGHDEELNVTGISKKPYFGSQ
jgi:hypothetical protein